MYPALIWIEQLPINIKNNFEHFTPSPVLTIPSILTKRLKIFKKHGSQKFERLVHS